MRTKTVMAAALLAFAADAASAQEVTLRAVTSFAEGTQFSKNFERFIQKVNADGKGLIVPVLKNAQDLNLLGLARGIADLAERARTKKLMPKGIAMSLKS